MTMQLPRRPDLTEVMPVSAAADGKLNSYCMRCEAQGQSMQYAACQWRQGVLSKADIRTPADWAPCHEAARSGTCVAVHMRREEDTAGQAIFFRKSLRENDPVVEMQPRKWVDTWAAGTKGVPRATTAPVTPVPRHADAVDAMADVGGYSEAITAMVATGAHVGAAPEPVAVGTHVGAPPEPVTLPHIAAPAPTALPGESPLAMARRIAAARAAAK